MNSHRGRCAIVALCVAALPVLSSCSITTAAEAPRCGATERIALIAQSVPSTSYIPCITALPAGWSSADLHTHNGYTRFILRSDRNPEHPVRIELSASCTVGSATPIAPRTPGGRTYLKLRTIDPRYDGTMYDIFPGGCVSYTFDFERGSHISLMTQLATAVAFESRQQLRLDAERQLGVRLDP